MKKTLTWITWLSLSAVSPIALAVGLGQASVSSYLNAPLDASLPLLESSDYALDDIRVSVAESSDFAAVGLEWTPLAASVRAQVQEQQGRRQVRLRSEQPMEEPWLDLLLTVEFPGGQQFRDITLLFDPQGYAQNDAQNTAPTAFASATARPASVATPSREGGNSADGRNANRGNNAYVGSGDTLWGVAERTKPSEASVQQMMMALLEANPAVFPSGNIHDMRAGQTLRVPEPQQVLARSSADAAAAIRAMNEAWRERRNVPLPVAPPAQPEMAPVSEAPAVSEAALISEASTVSEAAIAAAQTLQANLAAGGSEAVEPEALTRAELTEQLRLSQATLQQVLEERELMRTELSVLRSEVASLTQALNDALAAQERPLTPLAANMSEADNQSVGSLITRYQWPLALAAIVLLVGLLVWLRKRREETWEDVPLAEPAVKPTISPSAPLSSSAPVSPSAVSESASMSEAASGAYPTHPNDDDVNDSDQPTASHDERQLEAEYKVDAETETETEAEPPITNAAPPVNVDQWLVDDQGLAPSQDDTLRYEKSQASGLAVQGRQRRLGLHAVPANSSDNISLAPPPSSVPMSQLLASLGGSLPVSDDAEASPETAEGSGHRFIDYHPPTLNSAASSHDEWRTETPMQPTVEFASEPYAEPVPPAKQPSQQIPPRQIEEEWEIEEVAFKPRGLDNSEPPKSSK